MQLKPIQSIQARWQRAGLLFALVTVPFATFHGLGWLGLLPAAKFPGVFSILLALGVLGGALLCSLVLLVIVCMPPRYGANKRLIVELFLIPTAGLLAAAP